MDGPQMSKSSKPTRRLRAASDHAICAASVDFPTPPLPDNTTILRFTSGSSADAAIVDSRIVLEASHLEALGGWLEEEGLRGEPRLLYRASEHGWQGAQFHAKCNNQGPTLTIIKSSGGFIFGGYADRAWNSCGNYQASPKAFLFALHCHSGLGPTKMAQNGRQPQRAVYDSNTNGPTFGNNYDVYVANNANGNTSSYTNIGGTYQCPAGQTANTFLTGAYNYTAAEVEVYSAPIS